MRANELLFWLSARCEGSWSQFRAVVEELHSIEANVNGDSRTDDSDFPLHQQLRLNLENAAHAEFFECDFKYRWRVAPPVLAAHAAPEGFRAVFCGARSPALLGRILDLGKECGCERMAPLDSPEVIRFYAPKINLLSDIALRARVHFQPYAPRWILSCIRPYEPTTRRNERSEFPTGEGWRIRKFDPIVLHWRTSDRSSAQASKIGVFEFSLYDDWRYFLCINGQAVRLPRGDALYAVLPRRSGLLRYDEQNQTLSLPGTCRPPRLLERALVLCSGFPASFDRITSRLSYADVPADIAGFTAELLRQPLS